MAVSEDEKRRRLALMLRARHEALRVQIERLRAEADVVERAARDLEGLPGSKQAPTLESMFTDPEAHALASSRGKNADDPMLVAARAAHPKGYTLRGLAAAVGMSPAALSLARNGHKPIRRAWAEAIEKLIGFPAEAANWPGGIID